MEGRTYSSSSYTATRRCRTPQIRSSRTRRLLVFHFSFVRYPPTKVPISPILVLALPIQIFDFLALSHLHFSSPHLLLRLTTIRLLKPHSSPGCSKLSTLCAFPIPLCTCRDPLLPHFFLNLVVKAFMVPGTCLGLPIPRFETPSPNSCMRYMERKKKNWDPSCVITRDAGAGQGAKRKQRYVSILSTSLGISPLLPILVVASVVLASTLIMSPIFVTYSLFSAHPTSHNVFLFCLKRWSRFHTP